MNVRLGMYKYCYSNADAIYAKGLGGLLSPLCNICAPSEPYPNHSDQEWGGKAVQGFRKPQQFRRSVRYYPGDDEHVGIENDLFSQNYVTPKKTNNLAYSHNTQ